MWTLSSAARAWQVARRASAAESRGSASPPYFVARRWSPVAVPVALDLLLMTFAVLLARHAIGRVNVPWQHVGFLGVALAALSVVVGVALHAAPNDTVWTGGLAVGVALYMTVAVTVLFGPLAGFAAAVMMILAGGTFVRERLHPVMEHTVHVTTLFGTYHRTLLPGVNVLLPGERMLAILQTRPQEHTTLPLRARGPDGHENQATATMHYELVPEEAQRAVLVARDWERNLRRLLAATVLDELATWDPCSCQTGHEMDDVPGPGMTQTGEDSARIADVECLRARVEQRVRAGVLQWGVQVAWVHLHDVVLSSPAGHDTRAPGARPRPPTIVEGSLVPCPTGVAPGLWTTPQLQSRTAGRAGQGSTLPLRTEPEQQGQSASASAQQPDTGTQRRPPRLLSRVADFVRHRDHAPQPPEPAEARGNAPHQSRATAADAHAASGTGNASGAGMPMGRTPAGRESPSPAVAAVAPTVLASAYEAVREGRIIDPATVRQIADAFDQLAATTDPDADLDVDPTAAALLLRQRAQEITLARGYDPDQSAPSQGSSRRPAPPRVERDENVTAGG